MIISDAVFLNCLRVYIRPAHLIYQANFFIER